MPSFTRTQSGHRFNALYCSKKEQRYWEGYFERIHRQCLESTVSEMIDVNTYKRHRLSFKIARTLRSGAHKSFVFITCLN
ncbi:MAG: hypothetical protein ACR2IL_11760 [Chitinophagaceae bacterium]